MFQHLQPQVSLRFSRLIHQSTTHPTQKGMAGESVVIVDGELEDSGSEVRQGHVLEAKFVVPHRVHRLFHCAATLLRGPLRQRMEPPCPWRQCRRFQQTAAKKHKQNFSFAIRLAGGFTTPRFLKVLQCVPTTARIAASCRLSYAVP